MELNLFSDTKYYKLEELYNKYHNKLYKYLEEKKFILSNKHYLTYWSKTSNINITIFESTCVDDSNYPNRETWHEFSAYNIEFKPKTIIYKFKEENNEDNLNIEEIEKEYKLYNEIKKYIIDIMKQYKNEYNNIKN